MTGAQVYSATVSIVDTAFVADVVGDTLPDIGVFVKGPKKLQRPIIYYSGTDGKAYSSKLKVAGTFSLGKCLVESTTVDCMNIVLTKAKKGKKATKRVNLRYLKSKTKVDVGTPPPSYLLLPSQTRKQY